MKKAVSLLIMFIFIMTCAGCVSSSDPIDTTIANDTTVATYESSCEGYITPPPFHDSNLAIIKWGERNPALPKLKERGTTYYPLNVEFIKIFYQTFNYPVNDDVNSDGILSDGILYVSEDLIENIKAEETHLLSIIRLNKPLEQDVAYYKVSTYYSDDHLYFEYFDIVDTKIYFPQIPNEENALYGTMIDANEYWQVRLGNSDVLFKDGMTISDFEKSIDIIQTNYP